MSIEWTNRIWREFHAGTLTRAYRDTLLTLQSYRGRGGAIYPSHETLAERARCGVSTVQRALRHARTLGLVVWTERRVRAGWRWLRSSNSYVLVVPDTPVDATKRPAWWRRSTTGQSDRGGESLRKQGAPQGRKALLTEMIREAARAPDLLALRRSAIELMLLAGVK